MNISIIRRILGYVLILEAAMLLLPCIVALVYGESDATAFVVVSVLCLVIGAITGLKKPKSDMFYLKEGCVATGLSWIVLSLFGCLPFYITGTIPNFIDALFETVSGFTTTGASILSDVESLPRCMLFWRSFTHWIGGMGILVFLLAIVPLSGGTGSNINLMKAESPGPSVGKLRPKMRTTAGYLYAIYMLITVLEVVMLLCGKMPFFDAITTAMGTAGTGGFGIKNDSIGGYSPYIQWVVTGFMIAFGVNFNVYFLLIFGEFKKALSIEEIRWYFFTILSAAGILFASTYDHAYHNASEALRHSAFQTASIITTTGFSTADFDTWHGLSKTVLVLLMFVGACAGSTGGGIKVSRFVVAGKGVVREIKSYVHPKSVTKIKLDKKPLDSSVTRNTYIYLITFMFVFVVSMLLVAIEGKDLLTNFTAVAATINNIGPGLELVGPTKNFGFFTPFTKVVLIFDMLAGRLELFPMLLILNPAIWRDTAKQGRRKITKVNNKINK
ncbi:MAG: TrkH family potassium uptake protein [Eubacterium sp.]|nr:TrkH family potassium uptake protein [Eubacterium sp.]